MSVWMCASSRRALDDISIVAETSTSLDRWRLISVVLQPVMSSDWMHESSRHMQTRVGWPSSSSRPRRRVRPSSNIRSLVVSQATPATLATRPGASCSRRTPRKESGSTSMPMPSPRRIMSDHHPCLHHLDRSERRREPASSGRRQSANHDRSPDATTSPGGASRTSRRHRRAAA